ncbi:hypothetical protein OPQ81_007722 [Rhizoctonia solani]|nr:hypothetical protein OPQ81_007722 [Rhizoctonia solani]
MSQVAATGKLKRQAGSSDIEEAPVKQARTSVQNVHVCRYPPLRRSDSQGLDINAAIAVVEHLSHTLPVPSELQHRTQEEDKAGSTEEESQDEDAAWDRRAKAYRYNMLFRRPREPTPKTRRLGAPLLIKTASQLTPDSDSEDDKPLESANPYGTGEAVVRKSQRLMALRAMKVKRPQVSAKPLVNSVPVSHTNTLTNHVTQTTSKAAVTNNFTSISSPTHLQKTSSVAGPERPQPQNNHPQQSAIDAIAGHRSIVTPSTPVTPSLNLSGTSSLSSMPSQILRRSRRVAAKQEQQL